MAGKVPKRDSLVIGGTPKVFQDIGLSSLPMSINQKHVDYAVNGSKDYDHEIGEALLKQLPSALQSPVAVFTSGTHSDSSIVAMIELRHNGKQIVVPVQISGTSRSNGVLIDANAAKSVYAKDYSVSNTLHDAIQREVDGQFSLLYLDNKKTTELLKSGRVLIPAGSESFDGVVHSITEPNSPVKVSPIEQTQTQQFKRWFGNSAVTDENGEPIVIYHGSIEDFDTFDKDKIRPVDYDAPFNGFWFTSEETDAAPANQQPQSIKKYFLRVQNPVPSSVLKSVVSQVESEFFDPDKRSTALRDGARSTDDEVRYRLQDMGYDGIHYDGPYVFTEENVKEYNEKGETSFEDVAGKKYDLRNEDGQARLFRAGSGNEISNTNSAEEFMEQNTRADVWVVFEPNQIKSATDNIGLFSESDNTRYDHGYSFDNVTPIEDTPYVDPMYYKSAKVIGALNQNKFDAASLSKMLQGKGVKTDELKWLGLDRWLADKKTVSKGELLQYIKDISLFSKEKCLTSGDEVRIISTASRGARFSPARNGEARYRKSDKQGFLLWVQLWLVPIFLCGGVRSSRR